MDIKKWVPWNWFNREEDEANNTVPVQFENTKDQNSTVTQPLKQFRQEIDQLFDRVFHGFGLSSLGFSKPSFPRIAGSMIKPTLDLGASDKEYTIAVEVPGVDKKDIKLEVVNNVLTISGEKKQEKEEKDKNYYRMERSYGSFKRVLSLPEDADQNSIKAKFKNGVLTVTMPRKELPKPEVKQIEVKAD